jgi:hypothetical protein
MRSIPLSAWQVVGPFGFDPLHPLGERGYGPEEEVKAGALSRSYGDEVAGRVHWRAADRPADGHWPADLRHVFGSRNGAALGYAALRIRSPEDQDVALHIESGDRLALWVNGDLVFSSDTAPTDNGASQQAPAALKKGVNRLLVKTTEGGGGWGFRIAVDGRVPVEEDEMIFT